MARKKEPFSSLSPLGRGRPLSLDSGRVRGFQGFENLSEHTVGVFQNVIVPETNNAIALAFKPCRAAQIARAIGVLPAIKLNNQPTVSAKEVSDVGAKRNLSPKLESEKSAIAQMRPKTLLSLCLIDAQVARSLNILPFQKTPHPALSPAGRGF